MNEDDMFGRRNDERLHLDEVEELDNMRINDKATWYVTS
jgi:hypothetical protein